MHEWKLIASVILVSKIMPTKKEAPYKNLSIHIDVYNMFYKYMFMYSVC